MMQRCLEVSRYGAFLSAYPEDGSSLRNPLGQAQDPLTF